MHFHRNWGFLGTERGLREGLWDKEAMNAGYAEKSPGSSHTLLPPSPA